MPLLRQNPAGLLRLKPPKIRRVDWGFDFLGYTFKRKNGAVTARPTRKKLDEKRTEFWRNMVEHRARPWGWRLPIQRLRRKIRSFVAQYPLWQGGETWEDNLLRSLEYLATCPPPDAEVLGRELGRALDRAGDVGNMNRFTIDTWGPVSCKVWIEMPGREDVIVAGPARFFQSG